MRDEVGGDRERDRERYTCRDRCIMHERQFDNLDGRAFRPERSGERTSRDTWRNIAVSRYRTYARTGVHTCTRAYTRGRV